MENVLKLLAQVSEKTGIQNTYYSCEARYSSAHPDKVSYHAYVSHNIQSVEPVMWSSFDIDEMIQDIQKYLDGASREDVMIKYHQNQIKSNEVTIDSHNKSIRELEL